MATEIAAGNISGTNHGIKNDFDSLAKQVNATEETYISSLTIEYLLQQDNLATKITDE